MHESEQCGGALTHGDEDKLKMPTLLFQFQPGQFVFKHYRWFTKVDARAHGPFLVCRVTGVYH